MPDKKEPVLGGCGKLGCDATGWKIDTNVVPYGETWLVESWEAWCPLHGSYGQQGSGDVVWFDALPPPVVAPPFEEDDAAKAAYCGFNNIECYRKDRNR